MIRCRGNALQNPFRSHNLIRPHHQQLEVYIKHAVLSQHIQQRVLGEERLGKPHQLRNGLVSGIRPPTGERKTIRSLALAAPARLFFQVTIAHRVAVILGERAITNHKELHVLK